MYIDSVCLSPIKIYGAYGAGCFKASISFHADCIEFSANNTNVIFVLSKKNYIMSQINSYWFGVKYFL